jgi:hypothetical protein
MVPNASLAQHALKKGGERYVTCCAGTDGRSPSYSWHQAPFREPSCSPHHEGAGPPSTLGNLFPADCNKFTDRYASWTDEPNSEAVDAFGLASSVGSIRLQVRFSASRNLVHLPSEGARASCIQEGTLRRSASSFRGANILHSRILERFLGAINGADGAH